MHAKPFALILAAALTTITCPATNVGLGTIEQPVNLGAESDPARIPLGAVATESNYHYGRGPVITAPRPSLHGAMEWKSGTELNQNLASVFGIEVDNHDLPHSPATIHLKAYSVPAYSPYTKDQVLAATIHCLLRSNSGRPKAPIQLKFTVDSPDDQALVAKYSKDYVNAPDNQNGPPIESTPVPGTRLETDTRGITWVVFPDVKTAAARPTRPHVLIPFRFGGEGGPDDPTWELMPVWTGSHRKWEQSLEIIGRPYPLFYDCFNPSDGAGPEANALFAGNPRGSISRFDVAEGEHPGDAIFSHPNTSTETLAASILALVVSTQPTAECPLTVTLESLSDEPLPWLDAFKASPGWKIADGKDNRISCAFVWDPQTFTLTQGTVPLAKVVRTSNGKLYVEARPQPAAGEPPSASPAPVPVAPADLPEKSES